MLLLLSFFFSFSSCRGSDTSVYVVYTALIETSPDIADTLCVGERLTDARAKGTAGTILAVKREPALREDAGGVYSLPHRVTVAVTLGAEGEMTADGIALPSFTPRVGEALYLYGRARLEGICLRVRAI